MKKTPKTGYQSTKKPFRSAVKLLRERNVHP